MCAFLAPAGRQALKTRLSASIPRQRLAALPAGFPLQSFARPAAGGDRDAYMRFAPMQPGWRREKKRVPSRPRDLASFFPRRQALRVFVLTFVWVAGIARFSGIFVDFMK
jgi:hypothetical protein